MRLLELVAAPPSGPMRLSFHESLTVVGGLDAPARRHLIGHLDRAAAGVEPDTELHYCDDLGRHLVVMRRGDRRRVGLAEPTERGQLRRLPLPPPEQRPRTTHIDSTALRTATGGELTLPQVLTAMLRWLGRARIGGPGGQPTVAVLDEPFVDQSPAVTIKLLEIVERLASSVQTLYLSGDPVVGRWAARHAVDETLRYVTGAVLLT